MPHDPPPSAVDWLRYARSDLAAAAGLRDPGVLPSVHCFHAQQAAEKAIKAVYAHHAVEHDLIHDLEGLLNDLPMPAPADVSAARILTRYAVVTRYPHIGSEPAEADVADAIELARAVVEWAVSIVDPASIDS